jgi:hypothetical protein
MFGLDTSVGDVIAEFVDWLKLPTPKYVTVHCAAISFALPLTKHIY